MHAEATHPTPHIAWLVLNVIAQQFVFVALAFSYPLLLWVSVWVVQVPIALMWMLALLAPLTFLNWSGARGYFHAVAKNGWLFVAAAIVWNASYWWFSARDGTPVSYEAIKAHYERP